MREAGHQLCRPCQTGLQALTPDAHFQGGLSLQEVVGDVPVRGRREFSLLRGGIERNEPSLLTAVREVYKENSLKVKSNRYIRD